MAKTIKITRGEWFSIEREKARQKGYHYVEDLGGSWDKRDREIF